VTCTASVTTSFASRINERSGARAVCVALVLVALIGVLSVASGSADDIPIQEQTAALRERLDRLAARPDAYEADGAIEQARRALHTASSLDQDAGALVRAQRIARAAMALAESQLERRRARAELVAAQGRLTRMRERVDAQRRALERLMRERAALAQREEQP